MEPEAHNNRIYLSPPDQTGLEGKVLEDVLKSNWIAPVGPHLKQFESIICEKTGYKYAVALNSATSTLHLSMLVHDVQKGDEVLCSTLTFCAAANAILYVDAKPVFIDSNIQTWNIDVELLEDYLRNCAVIPKALIVTHIYGMPVDIEKIEQLSKEYGFSVIHDLAEAIGAKFNSKKPGDLSNCGVLSFNGNKLITTGGGGAFLTNTKSSAERVLHLATQAKLANKFYHHEEVGYNYRMSNVLAAIGIAQMAAFGEKVKKKRVLFNRYKEAFEEFPFIQFQEETKGCFSDRWLTVILIDQEKCNISVSEIIDALEQENIESRFAWQPMHLQPVYEKYRYVGGSVAESIFENGICLPSGTSLSSEDQERVIQTIKVQINKLLACQ